MPDVSKYTRAIAIDMIGFGKSEKPLDIDYNLQTYTSFLREFIEKLNLNNIVLVAMDMGLMIALNYAMDNEDRVQGIVMFEGFFRPVKDALKTMPLSARIIMKIMKNYKIAEKLLVKKGEEAVQSMISSQTVRKLSDEDMNEYIKPFLDENVRRKVWLEGIGPYIIHPKSKEKGDLTDLITSYSVTLRNSDIPILLLYANPGATVTEKSVKYAEENLKNIETKYIGKGKHFLPEDQASNIASSILEFLEFLK